jgi:hypothetical protein
MLIKTVLRAGAMATAVMGHAIRSPGALCGTPQPSKAHMAMSAQFAAKEDAFRIAGNVSLAAISVPTYFHVVATSTKEADGYLSVFPPPFFI